MRKYCKEPESIENFEKAKKDNFKGWHCHHRLETHNSDGERRLVDITKKELISLDMYYNRPAEELIYLTISEHRKLHKVSEETKNKISESLKGHIVSEEVRNRISKANKGHHHSEESKKKIGEATKGNIWSRGKHWYNNGKVNKFCYKCPKGFTPGMLRQKPGFIPVWFS